jgi:hypothetical protein
MKADIADLYLTHRRELLIEAERDRLAAQLPRRPSAVRHAIALACERAADWLDNGASFSHRYVQPRQSGPADWAA